MISDERDSLRVRNTVLVVTAVGWLLVATRMIGFLGPSASHSHHHPGHKDASWLYVSLDWLTMMTAMMTPLLAAPLRFVRGCVLARLRLRSTLLFITGYGAVWTLVGVAITLFAAWNGALKTFPYAVVGGVLATAFLWQCSPAKQVCLNGCHRYQAAAGSDPLVFGLKQGLWCVASCWALMLLPLLLTGAHGSAMVVAAMLIFCERLDAPSKADWRLRGLARAYRIVAARTKPLLSTAMTQVRHS